MTTEVPISPHLDLYRYWDGRRNGRLMPARRDIDPVDFPALLRHVSLIHNLMANFTSGSLDLLLCSSLDAN
jgi:hypothetical protein